jgi:hypothetical protein
MGSIAAIITAAAALAALIGGYVQFVLRRALLLCIEFDIEFSILDRSASDQLVGEILCIIRNVGPAVGFVTNVRCRVLYRISGESGVIQDGQSMGEPNFAHGYRMKAFSPLIQRSVSSSQRSHSGIANRLCSLRIHA